MNVKKYNIYFYKGNLKLIMRFSLRKIHGIIRRKNDEKTFYFNGDLRVDVRI